MNSRHAARFAAGISLFSILPACAVDGAEEAGPGEDNIETVEQAFNEVGCYNASVDNYISLTCSGGQSTGTAASPNGSYNHTDCTHAYISQSPFTTGVDRVTTVLPEVVTQADCAATTVTMRTYIQGATGEAELPTVTKTGTWITSMVGNYCTVGSALGSGGGVSQTIPFSYVFGGGSAYVIGVTAVAQAKTGSTYRKVTTTFHKPSC